MKCSEVLQYSDGLSNKVSNIIRRHVDNMKLLLIYSLGSIFFYRYIYIYGCITSNLCIFIVMSVYSYCMFMYLPRANWHSSATLTEDFPSFYVSCKANARVKPAKMVHGSHSSIIFVLFLIFCCSINCLFCVVLCIVCV